jgi:hypothetical protein
MLNAVMLSVIMLNVVVQFYECFACTMELTALAS